MTDPSSDRISRLLLWEATPDRESPRFGMMRFDGFEIDLRSAEIRRNGVKIELRGQPFEVLRALLERPGELVTRESLRQRLWPVDVFVDFDRGLNAAMKRLRRALGDDAHAPRFIETLPGRGYRFVRQLEAEHPARAAGAGAAAGSSHWRSGGAAGGRRWGRWVLAGTVVVALGVAAVMGLRLGPARPSSIGSLAVLPLVNLSGDPEQDYLAEGMTEALIGHLGRATDLRVISRQTVMRYKDNPMSVPAIARELDVEALVEGSVLQSGDRVRVTVQLIRADPERHLWTETYDRDVRDILALHDEIAGTIAREVRARITRSEGREGRPPRQVDPEAYRAYLRGRHHFHQWPEGLDKAVAFFQKSIEEDPTYAPAYAGLSLCYWSLGYFHPPVEMLARARAAAQKALELDEGHSEAHAALGAVKLSFDWDWDGAGREFRRAIELDPRSTDARDRYATYLVTLGRFDEAIAEAKRAVDLDPLSPYTNTHLGWVYHHARRHDEAIVHLREATELDPHYGFARECILWAQMFMGRYDEALAGYEALGRGPDPGRVWLLAASGRRREGSAMFRELEDLARKGRVDPYQMAAAGARLGEPDRAIALLEKAYEERNAQLHQVWIEPFFDGLRDDPRFWDIVDRVGPPEPLRGSDGSRLPQLRRSW